MRICFLINLVSGIGFAAQALHIDDASCGVTYRGIERDGLQYFHGIPYGQDTSGQNRFKPPRLYVPTPGSIIDATKPGVACPQPLGKSSPPLGQGNVTQISEDCLNLNIVRPKLNDTHGFGKLPVMVWIHGGKPKYLAAIGLADRRAGAPHSAEHSKPSASLCALNGPATSYTTVRETLEQFGCPGTRLRWWLSVAHLCCWWGRMRG